MRNRLLGPNRPIGYVETFARCRGAQINNPIMPIVTEPPLALFDLVVGSGEADKRDLHIDALLGEILESDIECSPLAHAGKQAVGNRRPGVATASIAGLQLELQFVRPVDINLNACGQKETDWRLDHHHRTSRLAGNAH